MKRFTALGLVGLSLMLGGCDRVFDALPGNYTAIAAIDQAPAGYEGQMVRVKGTVASATKLPFASTRFFVLRDAAGNELQVSTALPLPPEGREIWSQGRIQNMAIIQGMGVGAYFEETRRICQPSGGGGHFEKLLNCLTGQ